MDIGGSKSQIRGSFCLSVFSDRWRCGPFIFPFLSALFLSFAASACILRLNTYILSYWSAHFSYLFAVLGGKDKFRLLKLYYVIQCSYCKKNQYKNETHFVNQQEKMADGRPFEEHFISMPALGRDFELGDLYDYCSDTIVKGDKI